LWWLHPSWAFGLLNGITLLAALLLSNEAFQMYGTPKYVNLDFFLLGLLGIAAFVAGQLLAKNTGLIPSRCPLTAGSGWSRGFMERSDCPLSATQSGSAEDYCGPVVRTLASIWNVGDQSETDVRGELFPDDPWSYYAHTVRYGSCHIGITLAVGGRCRQNAPRVLIAALIGLAVIRMLLVSERLAVIELVIPAVVLGLRFTFLVRQTISPQTVRRLCLRR